MKSISDHLLSKNAEITNVNLDKIYVVVSKKVFHARCGEIIDRFVDRFVSKSACALRTQLKVQAEDVKKRKK